MPFSLSSAAASRLRFIGFLRRTKDVAIQTISREINLRALENSRSYPPFYFGQWAVAVSKMSTLPEPAGIRNQI